MNMRSAGVYLVEVEIGSVRNALIPQGDILITLRIGRSSAITTFTNQTVTSQLTFGTTMQLNVDHSALQTQRCSLSFNGPDKRIVGIALISLPKDKNFLQNTYRLTQNQEKRAEIEVKIRIAPFQSTSGEIKQNIQVANSQSSLAKESLKPMESSKLSDNIVPKIYANTLNRIETSSNNPEAAHPKSKVSEQMSYISSQGRKTPKNFKMREDDRMIQTTQSQLKRYKDQKQVYYQLYQIQKGKNQAASKFIASVLKKIAEKFPSLISVLSQPQSKKSEGQKKLRKNSLNNQSIDIAKVEQLQQANRSLHRQVQEYKKVVEQMKVEITRGAKEEVKPSKPPNNFLYPGIFDVDGKSSLKDKSNIKSQAASALKEEIKPSECLQEIDFKKWLNVSIGQRQSIQGLLSNLIQRPAEASQKSDILLKKLKASVDKSFTSLLARKEVTKEALIIHRKEVTRAFDEMLNV